MRRMVPRCLQQEQTLLLDDLVMDQCKSFINLTLDAAAKIDINDCRDWCHSYDIFSTPNILLFDSEAEEISRLDFAPSQDDFLIWVTTMLN